MMATKEPLRRCVRCKTKKKGCSRGSPCERCALAGLTADECIYLESDATYRNVKPKRKDANPYTPKPATNKVVKALSSAHGQDPGAIVRCSRCIRTARGCSHERPCQPCRENGLSEWECRYTSASSFKVRGPGARALRKVKSLDKIPAIVDDDDDDEEQDLVDGETNDSIRRIMKQERSHSTSSAPAARARLLIDQIPLDYRTPSPPTNISPISEPPNWREGRPSTASPTDDRTSITIPVAKPRPADGDEKIISTSLSVANGGTHLAASSVEPPPMMTLIPSISQQSHATIPESSPAIYTDDYQSSPSPYNSPQFQSSPPIHFQSMAGRQSGSLPDDGGLFAHQVPYRPPAGFTMPGHARQHAVSQNSQVGFAIPHQPLTNQQQQQQQQQYLQHQHNLQLQQQYAMYATSPPRQQHQQQQQMSSQFVTTPNSSFAQIPRQRAVPSPAPRYGSPHNAHRRPIYEHRVQSQHQATQQQQQQHHQQLQQQQQMVQAYPQAIPGRTLNAQQRYAAMQRYGMSPTDGNLQSPEGSYQDRQKPNGLSMLRHTSHQSHGSQGPVAADADDFDDADLTWHDAELVFSAE